MQLLLARDPGFGEAFARLVADRRESGGDVAEAVAGIIAEVRARGDDALADFTARFDGHRPESDGWRISAATCKAAFDALDPTLRTALETAAQRIRAYHEAQLPEDRDYTDAAGMRLGARWRPVDGAGLYVPGGRAAYPSSLLMNAIPAKVAGVGRLVVVTPTPRGEVNPLVLAAAHLAGVDEMWRVGGAQAVAALAYGTQNIAPVDVITGPGNAYVAEAKRQLYGVVGIDMVAGPSEILVIADADNDPRWIAADLLSQAEHDPAAQSILITDDMDFATAVIAMVEDELVRLPTEQAARESWDAHGTVIVVPSLTEAPALANALAAEHVEIATADAETLFEGIRHAGSVFLGRMTPEAVGDYVAGPNHVLPTGRRARFSSGLSVLDFMKRTSFIAATDEALAAVGPAAIALAEAEGLAAHARSVALRLPSQLKERTP
ncbi:MAG: histidinol dehydrogenase [Sphingomonadales bacterium]|nr:histidinol dehydrogenase [Sphingomonadales bacterium]MDE2569109.1 histidinol dehydrogenase [Sphingomonadales bacterium]